MQIIWKGQACFQITVSRGKEQVKVVIDPFEESIGLKLSPLEADIVLVSHDHFDHNNIKAIKGDPFVVTTPGEYEVKDVSFYGIPSFHDNEKGKERGANIIYSIEAEGIKLCHLGDLGQKELTAEQVEKIGYVDILFVPVGGTYTIDAKEAAKIISQLEPKIIIPMHYALPNIKAKLAGVQDFLSVMGAKKAEPEAKLTIKERDVAGTREEAEIVVLQP